RGDALRRGGMGVASRPESTFEQSATDGVFDELSAAVQVELVHDVSAVGVNGLGANREPFGDLVVGVAFGDELQDLALALGQRAVAVALLAGAYALEVVADHHALGGG